MRKIIVIAGATDEQANRKIIFSDKDTTLYEAKFDDINYKNTDSTSAITGISSRNISETSCKFNPELNIFVLNTTYQISTRHLAEF